MTSLGGSDDLITGVTYQKTQILTYIMIHN